MPTKKEDYIPALRFDWLTPLYDPILRWVMREERFKLLLVKQVKIQPGQRVLDLGCGTGTLTMLLKRYYPHAEVIGVDGDGNVLQIARQKIREANLEIHLNEGLAHQLQYQDQTFDYVFSSLVFHHLTKENKQRACTESFRILKPGGEFILADFGQPRNAWARLIGLLLMRLEEVTDNFQGLLPGMLFAAGFMRVKEVGLFDTFFGTISILHAKKDN